MPMRLRKLSPTLRCISFLFVLLLFPIIFFWILIIVVTSSMAWQASASEFRSLRRLRIHCEDGCVCVRALSVVIIYEKRDKKTHELHMWVSVVQLHLQWCLFSPFRSVDRRPQRQRRRLFEPQAFFTVPLPFVRARHFFLLLFRSSCSSSCSCSSIIQTIVIACNPRHAIAIASELLMIHTNTRDKQTKKRIHSFELCCLP